MHVRLPKPMHGWRAFAGEVGIIVLGVLIALGFGQIVEQWQWRREAGTSRQAIGDEIADSTEQAAERLAIEECLRGRIGELSARLKATDVRWTADPLPLGPKAQLTPHWDQRAIGRVYSIPLRGWSQDAWDTAKSTGAIGHMPHGEVADYSAIYAEIAAIRDFQAQELPLESKIAYLSADQRLDNGARTEALGTLGQLDALNAVIAGLSSLMVEQVKDLHLRVDRVARFADMKQKIESERQYRGACVKDVRIQF